MIALWIAAGVFAALLAAVILFSWKLSGMIVHPKVWDYAACFDEEVQKGRVDRARFESGYRREEFTLLSPFGYHLHCALLPHREGAAFPDGRPRVVVIVHGYTYCLFGSVKYADLFWDLGFDCVLYDHRNHGLSDKAVTTMGVNEARDLSAVCDWAFDRFGPDAVLGTHGESMGAATVMLQAPQDQRLSFAIEDCGYSDLTKELKHNIRRSYHLPPFPFLPLASLFSELRGGVRFSTVVPKDAVARCADLPMLFLHGEDDDFVPVWMVHDNYAAKPGRKAIRTFPHAAHAQSLISDPAAYRACVTGFLKENGVL